MPESCQQHSLFDPQQKRSLAVAGEELGFIPRSFQLSCFVELF